MSLDDLRREYGELTPTPVGGDLEREPAAVRDIVTRLRADWAAIALTVEATASEAGASPGPAAFAATAILRRRRRQRQRWFRGVAVAALLVATLWPAVVFLLGTSASNRSTGPGLPSPERVETVEHSPEPELSAPLGPQAPPRPEVLVATEDRVEMRSGAVRLVLIRSAAPPPDADSIK